MDIRYSNIENISSVLENFKKKYNIDESLSKLTFFKFWENIVGKKFKDVSKPVSINYKGVLQVACKNSMVTNELFMFKDAILAKIIPFVTPLNIKITDIVFSHKIWREEKENSEDCEQEISKIEKISDEELDKIELDENVILDVKNAVYNSEFISKSQKEKMFKAIIKNLKEQKYNAEKMQL